MKNIEIIYRDAEVTKLSPNGRLIATESWEREALLSRGELIALRLAQEQTELSGQIGERTRGDNISGQTRDKEGIIGDC